MKLSTVVDHGPKDFRSGATPKSGFGGHCNDTIPYFTWAVIAM